jgi:hypothetical protein
VSDIAGSQSMQSRAEESEDVEREKQKDQDWRKVCPCCSSGRELSKHGKERGRGGKLTGTVLPRYRYLHHLQISLLHYTYLTLPMRPMQVVMMV